MSDSPGEQAIREAGALGVPVSPDAAELLNEYVLLLNKWSASINLVGTAHPEDLVRYHLVDSLVLLPHLAGVKRLVDVGSGGGLPGAVLAAARPDLEVTALEPVHKKHAFLSALRRELGLARFTPLAERDDTHLSRSGFTPYEAAVSRATWSVPVWLERGAKLVVAGGLVLGMEGKEHLPLPAGAVRHPYRLGDRTRAIIVWRA
jgi:16S rRNA (guanine527-N7)-methyltransferase